MSHPRRTPIGRYPLLAALSALTLLGACRDQSPTALALPDAGPTVVRPATPTPARAVDPRAALREAARQTPGLLDGCGALAAVAPDGAALIGCPVRVRVAPPAGTSVVDPVQAELDRLRAQIDQGMAQLAAEWGGRTPYLRADEPADTAAAGPEVSYSPQCQGQMDQALSSTIQTVSIAVRFGVAYAARDTAAAQQAAREFWPSLSSTVFSIRAFLRCNSNTGDKRVN